MAVVKLYDLARMTTATATSGTITLGAAVSGFLTFAQAGIADGETVRYAIRDGANSEVGTGVYTAAGTTLTRGPIKSTNANAAITLSGTAEVAITAIAEDFRQLYLDDGAFATPSLTFGADPDTGLYRVGANNVGIAANGAKVLDIAAGGLGITGTLGASGIANIAGSGGTESLNVRAGNMRLDETLANGSKIIFADATNGQDMWLHRPAGSRDLRISSGGGTSYLTIAQSDGSVAIASTTASTTTTNGSLQTAGGLGVVKDFYLGGLLQFATANKGPIWNDGVGGSIVMANKSIAPNGNITNAISYGIAFYRDNTIGCTAIVLYDGGNTPVILGQTGGGLFVNQASDPGVGGNKWVVYSSPNLGILNNRFTGTQSLWACLIGVGVAV